jgi:hypothetical protein
MSAAATSARTEKHNEHDSIQRHNHSANHVERIMADAVCREHESDFRITSLSSFCNSITHSTPEQACLVCVDRNDECDGTCDWCDQAATSWAHGQHYCADCLEAE